MLTAVASTSMHTSRPRHVTNATMMNHNVVVDDTGKIVPWMDSNDAFGALLELAWKWWVDPANIPLDNSTGRPLYWFFGSYNQITEVGKNWPR